MNWTQQTHYEHTLEFFKDIWKKFLKRRLKSVGKKIIKHDDDLFRSNFISARDIKLNIYLRHKEPTLKILISNLFILIKIKFKKPLFCLAFI